MKKFYAILIAMALMAFTSLASAQAVNRVTSLPIIDAVGAGQVNIEGQKASYFAGALNNTPAAAATDVAILTGSATKTVKISRVRITVAATAAGQIDVAIIKRIGGTQSAVNTAFAANTNSGQSDSSDVASTVVAAGLAGIYTGNPASVGTVSGQAAMWSVQVPANGTTQLLYECTVPSKCLTLRGTTQIAAVNLNGDTLLTGEKFGIEFDWTEE
jgi:hypothetical protein